MIQLNFINWKTVSCGLNHSMGIAIDNRLYGWGSNQHGQLGDGTSSWWNNNISVPTQITSFEDWESVSCGEYHSAGIRLDGSLWTWGHNNDGQLGTSDYSQRLVPTQIGEGWDQVSCGNFCTMGVKKDGTLWAWGNASYYNLGYGLNTYGSGEQNSPNQIGYLTDWKIIKAGYFNHAAIKKDGSLWTWGRGDNEYGALGQSHDWDEDIVASPSQVGSSTNWKDVGVSTSESGGGYDDYGYGGGYDDYGDGDSDSNSFMIALR